jgi:hypothetical protein
VYLHDVTNSQYLIFGKKYSSFLYYFVKPLCGIMGIMVLIQTFSKQNVCVTCNVDHSRKTLINQTES